MNTRFVNCLPSADNTILVALQYGLLFLDADFNEVNFMRPQEIHPSVRLILSMNADAQTANSSGFIMSLYSDPEENQYQHKYEGSTIPNVNSWLIRAKASGPGKVQVVDASTNSLLILNE